MRKIFVSFANKKFNRSLERIGQQARKSGFYDDIHLLNEDCFTSVFKNHISDYLFKGNRGYGFWLWKPYVVTEILSKMNAGDVLHYADAGCHINKNGSVVFEQYINETSQSPSGFLCFSTANVNSVLYNKDINYYQWAERSWTKSSVFEYFRCAHNLGVINTAQIEATSFFICKNENSNKLSEFWFELAMSKPDLFIDSEGGNLGLPGFFDHRHDQSVFSVLCKLSNHPVALRSSYEYWNPFPNQYWPNVTADWDSLIDYPIHAKRDKDIRLVDRLLKKLLNQ